MAARAAARRRLLPRTVAGRRRLIALAVLAGSVLAGYLTTFLLYPRPLLRADRPVARVVGLPISEAEAALTRQGFKVKIDGEAPDPAVPEGHVMWQDPPADLILPVGATVSLLRSSGPAPVAVPDLAGFDLELATRVLSGAGLGVGVVDSVASQTEAGVVVTSRPNAGTGRLPGTTVDLVVSRGPATVRVPQLVGLTFPEARERLEAAGLAVGRVRRVSRRGPPNTVLEQRPASGAMSPLAARVDLVVSEVD